METISRKVAAGAGLKRFFTGSACSKGHVAERYTCDGKCCECIGERQRERNKSREFRNHKNDLMKRSGYSRRYALRYKEENRDRIRDLAKKRKVRLKERGEWSKSSTKWARAKRNAAKRVREVLLSQLAAKVGCDAAFFKTYMEARFQRGMTWDNYGDAWEVDHVVPISSFDLTTKEGLSAALHYSNLQPMWSGENAEKSDSMPDGHQPELVLSLAS